jgi:hypothetical protein
VERRAVYGSSSSMKKSDACGDDDGVGEGESVEEDLALKFKGRVGEGVEGWS